MDSLMTHFWPVVVIVVDCDEVIEGFDEFGFGLAGVEVGLRRRLALLLTCQRRSGHRQRRNMGTAIVWRRLRRSGRESEAETNIPTASPIEVLILRVLALNGSSAFDSTSYRAVQPRSSICALPVIIPAASVQR